ncbi:MULTISPECIES: hypothetical protein [Methylobacteriaceae]|uniref:hypothetical protein n=1 Tax=Methylobacteriaceae TaxID=119045 RepID=UPI002F35173F
MSDAVSLEGQGSAASAPTSRGPDLDGRMHPAGPALFALVLVGGPGSALYNLIADM